MKKEKLPLESIEIREVLRMPNGLVNVAVSHDNQNNVTAIARTPVMSRKAPKTKPKLAI